MGPVLMRIFCGTRPVLIINNYNYNGTFTGSVLDFCEAISQHCEVETQFHTGFRSDTMTR